MAEGVADLLSRESGYETGLHHAVVDEPGDEMPLPQTDSVIRRVLTSPAVLLFAGLAVVALVAERSLTGAVLTGSGTLGGGALVPAWGSAGAMWREYLAGYHDAGIGSTASTPPYVAVVAALATVVGSKPWLAVDVLLFGCVPAAGVTAFLATRRVTSVLAARVWVAATYALLPVAMGAVAAGRIGTAVAFVLLPLIAIMIGRMRAGPPRGGAPRGLGGRPAGRARGRLRAADLADGGARRAWRRRGLALARPADGRQRRLSSPRCPLCSHPLDLPPGHEPGRPLRRSGSAAAGAGRRGPAAAGPAAAQSGRTGASAGMGDRGPGAARLLRPAGPAAAGPGVHRLGHRADRAGHRPGGQPGAADAAAGRDRCQCVAGSSRSPWPRRACCWRPCR